jgi:phosphodiesterase/alkaline phosphatase D-like protein
VTPNGAETSYWFEYGESTDLGSITAFHSTGNGTTPAAVSVALAGLKPLTKYYVRVNAQNQFGTTNGAIVSFSTTGPAAALAPTAATRAATNISTSTALLHGMVNPRGALTTYWFEYSSDSLLGTLLKRATTHVSAGSATGQTSVTATTTGLVADTKYYFRIIAESSAGSVMGDIQSFTTKK